MAVFIESIYSYRKASTGFLVAARQLCQLTVPIAIRNAERAAIAKIHQLNSVLYANWFCQCDIIRYDAGIPINEGEQNPS